MMGRKQFYYPNLLNIKSLFLVLIFIKKIVKITLALIFFRCYRS